MTDSEIKQAVEKCIIHKKCKNCMFEDESGCSKRLLYLAYNLINRLQEKNKAYKYYYDECLKDLKKANKENERLKEEVANMDKAYFDVRTRLETAKAEAYKECIEKVRKLAVGMHPCSDELRIFDSDLDNLLKELVGEDK